MNRLTVILFALAFVALAAPALLAQDKLAFITDLTGNLEYVEGQVLALEEAVPQDKYDWRPMEGVRSVSEVLMLAAMEGYSFIPNSFGGKPADLGSKEEMGKLRSLNNKAQVIEHINKGFAHAKAQLEAMDNATLTAKRALFGQQRSAAAIALLVGGDLHEHLGQLIAYARMNKIVPPWSK